MDIIQILKEELQIGRGQAEAAVKLIDEGNTIPFIARYRKEATGSLNDEVLRNLDERLKYLRNLEDRKEQILSSIRDQNVPGVFCSLLCCFSAPEGRYVSSVYPLSSAWC